MAKKNEIDVPAQFGGDWHLYQPKARIWMKYDVDNPGKVFVVDALNATSVDVLDEADVLETYKPCADVRVA